MLCVAWRQEAEAVAGRGATAAAAAVPPRADRARGVDRRKGVFRRRDGDEAAARRSAAAFGVGSAVAPPRADRA